MKEGEQKNKEWLKGYDYKITIESMDGKEWIMWMTQEQTNNHIRANFDYFMNSIPKSNVKA